MYLQNTVHNIEYTKSNKIIIIQLITVFIKTMNEIVFLQIIFHQTAIRNYYSQSLKFLSKDNLIIMICVAILPI